MLDLMTQKSYQISFQERVTDRFPQSTERIALLVSSEYEGYYKNGGIGTYYTALSQRLTADGWYVILLLCATEAQYNGKSKTPALQQVYSVSEVKGLLNLNPIAEAMLDEANFDIYDHQSFCVLFFTQALLNQCQQALVYAEFPEMCGFGYRTMQARQAGLLERCVTAVTVHSGHEWVYEANQKFTVPYPNYFWQTCHYEQVSFEKADLSFYPSNFIRTKVESYGWQANQAIRLPYFVPQIKSAVSSNPALPGALTRLEGGKIPLVFFARLEERKGLCTFVQALKQLAPELSQRCHLFFLGKVVSLFSYDLKHLDSQQYLDQELQGIYTYDIYSNLYSEQALDLIRNLKSAIVCLTSPQDNFPNSALEVGQLPVSIIAANTGGFRETLGLLERSDGVHWFTPGDVQSLVACFQKVLPLFPESPEVPAPDFLEQLNHKLLIQRTGYIAQVNQQRNPVESSIAVSIFCGDDDPDLLACLNALHQQTLKPSQIFILDRTTTSTATQQLLTAAQEQFPHCHFLRLAEPQQAEAIADWLSKIQQYDYTLLMSASDIPTDVMLQHLSIAITHAGGNIACSPPLRGTTAPQVNSYRTGFLPQMLFSPPPRMPLLVTPELLVSLKPGSQLSLDALVAQLLVDTAGQGRQLIYFPYPLHWTSKTAHFANPEVWLQACFKVREYLAEIAPTAWNPRQIYMLMSGMQHLSLPSYTPGTSENTTTTITSIEGSGFKSLGAYDVSTLLKASAWKLAKRSYSSISQYESFAPVARLRRKLVQFFSDNSR